MSHDIADPELAEAGALRVEWAGRRMPVLAAIRERFERERPLEGKRIGAATDQPVEIRPELDAGNPGKRALEIVRAVLDFVGVVVQIQDHAVRYSKRDDVLEDVGLGIQLLVRLPCVSGAGAHGCAQSAAAQFGQARYHQLGITFDIVMGLAVPHSAAE